MTYIQHQKFHEYSIFRDKRPLLGHLDIELTERCNNNCIHCYINQPQDDEICQPSEANTEFIKNVLQQAADLGCLDVRFTGGEPLLREDFQELYLFARRLGLRVTLFTNARLINVELCQLFEHFPPGQPIEVSVYGMHAHSYDAVAASRGAFEQFWRGTMLLNEHGIPFMVKQSLLPQNRAEIPEFEAFAANLPYMDHTPPYGMNYDLRTRRDNPAKNQRIKNLRLSPEETLAMLTREPEKYIKSNRKFASKFLGQMDDRLFNCGAGLGTCVDAYGNAQMCMPLRHPDMVYPLDPKRHWSSHPETDLPSLEYALRIFFSQLREMKAVNPEYVRRCAVCFLKGLCEQCPGRSWEEYGTLDTPVEYLCQVAHVQARYLELVKEGENAWELQEAVWRARLQAFTKTA